MPSRLFNTHLCHLSTESWPANQPSVCTCSLPVVWRSSKLNISACICRARGEWIYLWVMWRHAQVVLGFFGCMTNGTRLLCTAVPTQISLVVLWSESKYGTHCGFNWSSTSGVVFISSLSCITSAILWNRSFVFIEDCVDFCAFSWWFLIFGIHLSLYKPSRGFNYEHDTFFKCCPSA